MPAVIAVHCGAGTHNSKYFKKYNALCKQACHKAIQTLKNGGDALSAVKAAIIVLENDPLTNCGLGSNLTLKGYVEADASIMDGKSLIYGACGAVKNLKNPIELAYNICLKQAEILPLGLIPPSFLVGKGATEHAKKEGIKTVTNKKLISEKALKQHRKYKKILNEIPSYNINDEGRLDTVGAVCIDNCGHVASGCSSGGILLKKPGRVGQAAIYGCGAWADSYNTDKNTRVAVSTSGCGEYLIRTILAKEIAEGMQKYTCPTIALNNTINEKFLKARYLQSVDQKLCGALVLNVNAESGEISVLWGHTTESMSIGYMSSDDKRAKGVISQLPREVEVGKAVNVGGTHFYAE